MDLIKEARKKGYRGGLEIIYPGPGGLEFTEQIEGNHFEMMDGKVVAFALPRNERKLFEDNRFDTLYDPSIGWTEIAKP